MDRPARFFLSQKLCCVGFSFTLDHLPETVDGKYLPVRILSNARCSIGKWK